MAYTPKYFQDHEFTCRCCGRLPSNGMSEALLKGLDALREEIAEPLFVTNGYRCPRHNAEVGGVANSQHMHGTAADVYADNIPAAELAEIAKSLELFDGVGVYHSDGFVHLDCRDGGKSPNWYRWNG